MYNTCVDTQYIRIELSETPGEPLHRCIIHVSMLSIHSEMDKITQLLRALSSVVKKCVRWNAPDLTFQTLINCQKFSCQFLIVNTRFDIN